MSRPLVSVVLATYQRAHLLARSLVCYERQAFDNDRFEIVVIDDHSTDGTRELVTSWSARTGIRATVLTPHPKKVGWRDCGAVLNYGIRAAAGDYILLTHPEVMPGRDSVAACVDGLRKYEDLRTGPDTPFGVYACCRVYYLSAREQALIDTCEWPTRGAAAVRDIEGFYELDVNGHPDYSHRATDKVGVAGSPYPTWESWVFGGCSRETWRRLGGMLESSQWGSVDVAFTHRRRTLGIANYTCGTVETTVVHQNHDDPALNVPTDRDMDKWVKELKDYPLGDPTAMRYPAVDHLGWGSSGDRPC